MEEHRVEERIGVLDVLQRIEQDHDVVRAREIAAFLQDVVIEDPPLPDVAVRERLDVEVGAVERPLRRAAPAVGR